MKKKQIITEKISVEEYNRKRAKKRRIIKLIFSLLVISLTAGGIIGISFAISIINKHNDDNKTGELKTNASYEWALETNNIYR